MADIRCPVKSCIHQLGNDRCELKTMFLSQDFGSEDADGLSCDSYEEKEAENGS